MVVKLRVELKILMDFSVDYGDKIMESEIEKLKRLLWAAYNHLDYCGWGDKWEREVSANLRKELDEYFMEKENEN